MFSNTTFTITSWGTNPNGGGGAVRIIWILGVLALLEGYSRMLGWWDYKVHKRTHVVWDIAWTTKEVKNSLDTTGIHITSPHSPAKRK